MPTVLLDACLPLSLQRDLAGTTITPAKSARFDMMGDKALLGAIAGRYEVFVTLAGVLALDDETASRPFAVVILKVRDLSPGSFRALAPKLAEAIRHVMPGDIVVLSG